MQTSVLECTAEDLVAHKLQRAGLLVAKPRFDLHGADLLALAQVSDGARFARIQCKGRTLRAGQSNHVEIKSEYVSSGLVVFLFIETEERSESHLYCFFRDDLNSAWRNEGHEWKLSLSAGTFRERLLVFEATHDRIAAIKHIIPRTTVDEEFRKVIFATIAYTEEGDDTFSATAVVEPRNAEPPR